MGIEGFNFNQANGWTGRNGRNVPVESGLILQEQKQKPPKENFSQKPFNLVKGEIVLDARVASRNNRNNSNQHEAEKVNDTRDRLAYANSVSAYGKSVQASVREQVRASATEQGIARANMIDLNQPIAQQSITQQQFLALNKKLDTIGGKLDQLNSLLGDKSANTEAWNLKKGFLADNLYGNSELDVA